MCIWKLVCINYFHVYFMWLQAYWVTMVLSNYPHYNFQCYTLQLTSYHNLHEVQIPNTPSFIFINLFYYIKSLFYNNIGFLGCKYYKKLLWQLHWNKDNWLHIVSFCECHVINKSIKPMPHILFVIPILYFF